MEFHGLTEADIPKELQPSLSLEVEVKELGIVAGLMDRVSQVLCAFQQIQHIRLKETGPDFDETPTISLFVVQYLGKHITVHHDVGLRRHHVHGLCPLCGVLPGLRPLHPPRVSLQLPMLLHRVSQHSIGVGEDTLKCQAEV